MAGMDRNAVGALAGVVILIAIAVMGLREMVHSVEQCEHAERAWDGFVSRPWLHGNFHARQVDTDGYVFEIQNFVSAGEAEELRRLLEPSARDKLTSRAGFSGARGRIEVEAEYLQNPVVKLIQERIAVLTGIPPHADEVLQLTLSENNGDTAHPWWHLHNVHLDRNERQPRRVASVLLHLAGDEATDGDSVSTHIQGGDTIFPCVDTRAGEGASKDEDAKRAEVCRALQTIYEHPNPSIKRLIDFSQALNNKLADVGFDRAAAAEINSWCVRSPERMLRFKPSAGAAILILNGRIEPNASTHTHVPHVWHGGCRVTKGSKLLLASFKELPSWRRPSRIAGYCASQSVF
mmetsp:Transcript_21772/g.45989  ORF Transcript_21772/g.45989 Transcript_21772/m.45989 type:complete len:349 (-) Transcript_21772:493-1539(-)